MTLLTKIFDCRLRMTEEREVWNRDPFYSINRLKRVHAIVFRVTFKEMLWSIIYVKNQICIR